MQFEPFMDRLSRDIRNDLSATMTTVLKQHDIEAAQQVADQYLVQDIDRCYREYINDRLARYRSFIEKVSSGTDDVFWQALILWDHRLFFEVHEVLEDVWYNATGSEKKILQAMIRAAGVYIKLEYGYDDAAQKLAHRAISVLSNNREYLGRYFDPENLLSALSELNPEPPRLLT